MHKLLALLPLPALLLAYSCKNGSPEKEATVHVWGNCGQCKATIDKACMIDGVKTCDWGVESKLMTVKYDTTKVSLDNILDAVAKSGYDNEKYYANDYAYEKLEACCKYERRPFESK